MKTFKLLAILFFYSNFYFAQLNGDLTIGGSSPDYETIQDAITDINTQGMDASVNFILREGTYSGPWGLGLIDGMTDDRLITFSSELADSSSVFISAFELNDENYIWNIGTNNNLKFENLTFHVLGSDEIYKGALGTESGAGSLEWDACHFMTDQPQFTWYLEAYPMKDLTMQNCRLENVGSAMYCSSSNYTATFIGNTFISFDDMIDLENFDEILIRDNHFMHGAFTQGTETFYYGDYCTTVYGNISKMTVEDNLYEGNFLTMLDVWESPIDSLFVRNNSFDVYDGEVYIEYAKYILYENNINLGTYYLEFDECAQVNVINSECNYIEISEAYESINVRNNTIKSSNRHYGVIEIYSAIIEPEFVGVIEANKFISSMDSMGFGNIGIELNQTVMNNEDSFKILNNSIINSDEPFDFSSLDNLEVKYNSISGSGTNEVFQTYDVLNAEISNNIIFIYNDSLASGKMFEFNESFDIDIHDNVYFWNEGNFEFLEFNDVDYLTIEDAQNAGYATNAQFVDPMFFDPSSDLRICNEDLQGSGVEDDVINVDYFDFLRPNLPTPGFYEFIDLNANFIIDQSDNFGVFTAENLNAAESVMWDFGDGETSDEMNPSHTYNDTGDYTVTLTVSNPCGDESISQTISIISIGVEELNFATLNVYPNPSDGLLNIKFNDSRFDQFIIVDTQGREVFNERLQSNSGLINLNLNSGIYLYYGVDTKGEIISKPAKLVVRK